MQSTYKAALSGHEFLLDTTIRQHNLRAEHECTAVGDGHTSPTTKLYQFYHLPLTVQISFCLMHGRIQKVLKTVKVKHKVMANRS